MRIVLLGPYLDLVKSFPRTQQFSQQPDIMLLVYEMGNRTVSLNQESKDPRGLP